MSEPFAPHENPIPLGCGTCGFEWTVTVWLPLDAMRFGRLLKLLAQCPKCGTAGKKIVWRLGEKTAEAPQS